MSSCEGGGIFGLFWLEFRSDLLLFVFGLIREGRRGVEFCTSSAKFGRLINSFDICCLKVISFGQPFQKTYANRSSDYKPKPFNVTVLFFEHL